MVFLDLMKDHQAQPRKRFKIVCLGLSLFILPVSAIANDLPIGRAYVSYSVFQTQMTDVEDRRITLQVFLGADGHAGYRYREQVAGSKAQSAKSTNFWTEYPWDEISVTEEQKARLINSLLAIKVFDLKSEAKINDSNYSGHFSISLGPRDNAREKEVHFFTPPLTSQRKTLHETMLNFARELGIDKPKDVAKATTVTEGDLEKSRETTETTMQRLLADPDKYHGKRVSVVGFHHSEFEGHFLSADETTSKSRDYARSVWKGEPSSFADKSLLNDKNDSWLRVEGIFLKGPTGHMGLWPGEIVRITRIEPVQPPR